MDKLCFEFDDHNIREENDQYSVYDLISILGGYSSASARQVFKRIEKNYPGEVTICDFISFTQKSGRKGRKTPVTDRKGILKILGLLPGTIGKKYRTEAAQLFLEYLDFPEEVAKKAILKLEDPEKVEEVREATDRQRRYLQSFHGFMDVLYQFGCTGIHFGTVNRANNNLVDVSGSRTNNMTQRQRDELEVLQVMQRIRLEDEQARINQHNRPDWEAVDTSLVQGAKTLAHIRGCSEQEAMNKVQLSPQVENWKRPQLNQRLD